MIFDIVFDCGMFGCVQTLFHQLKNKLKVPRHSHSHMGDADMEEDDDGDEDDEDWLTRDEFNLHKMVLATTSAGKVIITDIIIFS